MSQESIILLDLGVPDILQFDNGKEIKNSLMRALSSMLGFEIINSRANNPQAQGLVERGNGLLCGKIGFLMQITGSKNWAALLPLACGLLNNQKTRKLGMSPHTFVTGIPLYDPLKVEILELAKLLLNTYKLEGENEEFQTKPYGFDDKFSEADIAEEHESAADGPKSSFDDSTFQAGDNIAKKTKPGEISNKETTVAYGYSPRRPIVLGGREFIFQDVDPDGACFFHAVRHSLRGDPTIERHTEQHVEEGLVFRERFLSWCKKNKALVSSVYSRLESESYDFEARLAAFERSTRTWAGPCEMTLMAIFLKKDIISLGTERRGSYTFRVERSIRMTMPLTRGRIFLLHHQYMQPDGNGQPNHFATLTPTSPLAGKELEDWYDKYTVQTRLDLTWDAEKGDYFGDEIPIFLEDEVKERQAEEEGSFKAAADAEFSDNTVEDSYEEPLSIIRRRKRVLDGVRISGNEKRQKYYGNLLSGANNSAKLIQVGKNVRVPLPKKYITKVDDKAILGVVLGHSSKGYSVGTKFGRIVGSLSEIEPIESCILSAEAIPTKKVTFKEIASAITVGHPETAYLKCSCKAGDCMKCKCARAGRSCTSHCSCGPRCRRQEQA